MTKMKMRFFLPIACVFSAVNALKFKAIAVLEPLGNSQAAGKIIFEQTGSRPTTISYDLTGFTPNSEHGFHIHQFGDMSSTNGLAAAGHYNPNGKSHGCKKSDIDRGTNIHVGDLGNIVVDEYGNAMGSVSTAQISLGQLDNNFVVGRGVIIHDAVDDCKSQPVGNAGARLAQGVIGYANGTLDRNVVEGMKLDDGKPTHALAMIKGLGANSAIKGQVTFYQKSRKVGVEIQVSIMGLEPHSEHGLHIHQFGDISSTDGAALGGHFNPAGVPHACGPSSRHAGDIGNVKADDEGNVATKFTSSLISLHPRMASFILGRGIILHHDKDDCKTQPTGNAGGRIAQGVIGYRNDTMLAK